MKVLYTSGYTDDTIVHEGHLDPGVALLRKPYRKSDLAQKIREVLRQRLRSPPAGATKKGAAGWLPPRSNSCARWSRAESAPMPGL